MFPKKSPITLFTVMTIQEGEAPALTVQDTSDRPMVLVGTRVVRFDGEKIVFED